MAVWPDQQHVASHRNGGERRVGRAVVSTVVFSPRHDLEVVAMQPSKMWMQDEGFAIAQDMLQRHPDITIFFGRADALAIGPMI